MKFIFMHRIHLLLIATALMLSAGCIGCMSSHDEEPPIVNGKPQPDPDDDIVLLSIKINLSNTDSSTSMATRTGEEYEPDKWAANDLEKMHTVRVIILNSAGFVEHNSLWDLTAAPDIKATGEDFPVTAPDDKTILLFANEQWAKVREPDGSVLPASEYLSGLSAHAGVKADMTEIRAITHSLADNTSSTNPNCLAGPLAMSAIHSYHVDKDRDKYSATFNIHRAAVKYTYRFTNQDTEESHSVDNISINNIAGRQYLFPNADFTDESQMFFSEYRTPAGAGRQIVVLNTGRTINPGETLELGPFYFPESEVVESTSPYSTAFTFDGIYTGWCDLNWAVPQFPDKTALMTDLPRNTHVIVNVKFSYSKYIINYTVCPWDSHEVDLPDFN